MATPISTVTPYAGQTPAKEQEDTVFDANIDDELAYINVLPVQLNTTIGELNTFGGEMEVIGSSVETDAATATAQAALAEEWATSATIVEATDYSAKEYAIGTTVESAKRHASGTVATGSAKDWASSTTEVADGLKGARGYAQDSQTALSDVQSVIALAETVPFTLTSGDDFDSLSKVWPLIRTAFETNSLPWKPIVNLDFARDNHEAYVGLSAGTTRAPLLDLATFSRAGSGTGVNAFGNIETVGANQPRIVFENGVAKGILLENTATNLLTWSEDFANWTHSASYSISSDFTESPEQGLFADLLLVSNGQNSFNVNVPRLTVTKTAESKTYTHSCYFKSSGGSATHVRILNFGATNSDTVAVVISLIDGSVLSAPLTSGGFSSASVKVKTSSRGFFKVELTFTTDAHTSLTVRAFPYTGLSPFTGDGVNGLIAWGAQLEESSTSSSYIKTEGASVVRADDGLSKTLPTQFNSNGNWAIRGEFTTKSNVFDTSVAFTTITDDTAVNEVTLRPDASGFMSLLVNANSVAISASSSVLLAYDTVYKFMIVKDGDNYHLYLNGLLAATVVNTEAFDATVVKFGQGRLDSTKTNLVYSDHQVYTAFDYDADFDVFAKVVTGV